jgi:raffinose/stachyose/melibiose transport system substrate-binding protein
MNEANVDSSNVPYSRPSFAKRALLFVKDNVAALLIACAFVWAASTVFSRELRRAKDDAIEIRVAHWQLETGFRIAIDEMGKEFSDIYYKRTGKRVRIIQDAIPETVYGQFASTNLIGGTAPDLMATGLGLPWTIWRDYLNRYFVPLTSDVAQPNPYNVGTELEGVPLLQTYIDGGRGSYNEDLQNYMTVPLTIYAMRLFYNEDLFQQHTGLTEPPKTWAEFIQACEKIKQGKTAEGNPIVPVAMSQYHVGLWGSQLADPLTWSLLKDIDFNRDSTVSAEETFAGIRSGRISFKHPTILARFQLVDQSKPMFPDGWVAKQRDEAVFLFAQQKAVFIPTGTWDALSLQQQAYQADGTKLFTVRAMQLPAPAPNDPNFGQFALARLYDRPMPSGGFGITRQSKHREIAFEFLQYLASKDGNQRFNNTVGWIPAIRGALPPENLRGFEPNLEGIYNNFSPTLGGRSQVKWDQLLPQFNNGEKTFDQMMDEYQPYYIKEAKEDYDELRRNWKRGNLGVEMFLVSVRHDLKEQPADRKDEMLWRYVTVLVNRQIWPTFGRKTTLEMVAEATQNPTTQIRVAPYELLPEARERAKAKLRGKPVQP